MANLLSRKHGREPFPAFDPQQRARFEERARCLSGLDWPGVARELSREVGVFSLELEELEAAPSLAATQDLLERVDRIRRSILSRPASADPLAGDWLCYLPGRSLSTGEAEIASRGFFDALDRPPPGLWLEAVERRASGSRSAHELAIVCWIPVAAIASARAGHRACVSGALAALDDVSPELSRQIREMDVVGGRDPVGSLRAD